MVKSLRKRREWLQSQGKKYKFDYKITIQYEAAEVTVKMRLSLKCNSTFSTQPCFLDTL